MNFSSLIGLLLGGAVLYRTLISSNSDLHAFIDLGGLLVVCGGTAAAASICFPINKVLSLPSVRERYASLGAEPTALSPEDLGRLIRAEEKKWATVVKQANIRVD